MASMWNTSHFAQLIRPGADLLSPSPMPMSMTATQSILFFLTLSQVDYKESMLSHINQTMQGYVDLHSCWALMRHIGFYDNPAASIAMSTKTSGSK